MIRGRSMLGFGAGVVGDLASEKPRRRLLRKRFAKVISNPYRNSLGHPHFANIRGGDFTH